ncbi:OLC1v1019302C1 [Oldenlandia corymbosa var. corymbosa]|uniref:OLC1v1019302C1 n=1 Tax=Oldenlandia corymbosa var. corymbosa TaxID=529605 RepID=A0AAV1EDL2_OLDCO|nr:OLC1v1019302C1 [Oldenlandia corymbosa var. corymbosa]
MNLSRLGSELGKGGEREKILSRDESKRETRNRQIKTLCKILDELIFEILSRLPAKSLGRFKCVSRSMLSLISSRGFVKAHLAISSGQKDFGHHGMIFELHPPDGLSYLQQCSLSSVVCPANSPATTELSDIDYRMKNPRKSFWVLGSCNVLVCISTGKGVQGFLWNPCTKRCKKLPNIDLERKGSSSDGLGFGYDKSKDDYKVVRMLVERIQPPESKEGVM